MKKKRRLVSYILTFCILFVSVFSSTSYASERSSEIVTIENKKYRFEKIISDEGVEVTLKGLDSPESYTGLNNNEGLFLNGEKLVDYSEGTDGLNEEILVDDLSSPEERSVKWGNWNHTYKTIKTGGLSVAAICVVISAAAPWVSVRIVSGLAGLIAGSYSSVKIKISTQLGTDAKYDYYRRYTYFYGNGTVSLGAPFKEERKKAR